MTAINYVAGDATQPVGDGAKIIAHICNDVGGWGKGFVLALSKRWPKPEESFRDWYRNRPVNDYALGATQLVEVEEGLWVANMIGQHGLRAIQDVPPIRYEAVSACLQTVAELARERQASVHMPRIGCGLAGGEWSSIEPLIEDSLIAAGVDVTVYDFVP